MNPSLLEPIDEYEVQIAPLLRQFLRRCERDPRLFDDLDACNFQPYPSPSDEIDCLNPWFFVIAMNGGGSAYGLYLHPAAKANDEHPWVFWEHEDDTLRFMADNTELFLCGLIADTRSWTEELDALHRVAEAVRELGVDVAGKAVELDFDASPGATWLPPIGGEVESVDVYLAMLASEPALAERGMLAHRMRNDERATKALQRYYEMQGWAPPQSYP